jgi:beta-phosphoglucomutase
MLKAIIFDFNGVILNDEPLHFRAMQEAVAGLGVHVTEQEYWDRYLPLDDWSCLSAICRDKGRRLTDEEQAHALSHKMRAYQRLLQGGYPLFPGVAQFIARASSLYPLAVATGARREEVMGTLAATGLEQYFTVVVSAQDFTKGKPHPESFLLALQRLNERLDGLSQPVAPAECLVIEDSVHGVRGALEAGMTCIAVANTYPREKLSAANLVVGSLCEMDVESLPGLFEGIR